MKENKSRDAPKFERSKSGRGSKVVEKIKNNILSKRRSVDTINDRRLDHRDNSTNNKRPPSVKHEDQQ